MMGKVIPFPDNARKLPENPISAPDVPTWEDMLAISRKVLADVIAGEVAKEIYDKLIRGERLK